MNQPHNWCSSQISDAHVVGGKASGVVGARSGIRHSWRSLVLIATLFVGVLLALSSTVVRADSIQAESQRTGFRIDYPSSLAPKYVAWEEPGKAWFTSPELDLIGLVTRNSDAYGKIVSFNIQYLALDSGTVPYDIVYADDTVWYTAFGTGKLGRIDVSGSEPVTEPTAEYALPTTNTQPTSLAVSPDGTIWIVSANVAELIHFDPVTEQFETFDYSAQLGSSQSISTETTYPDIAIGSSIRIWFTVPGASFVSVYEVERAVFSKVGFNSSPAGFTVTEPTAIVVDASSGGSIPGGNPWVVTMGQNLIGRYSPDTLGAWYWLPIPTENAAPRDLAFYDNGGTWDFWFTENSVGQLGRLNITSDLQSYKFSEIQQVEGSKPWGITVGGDEHVWYAQSGNRLVSELVPPYTEFIYMPSIFVSE